MLDASAFEVHPDPRKAEGLPAEAFTSPEFLDLELGTIFRSSWLLVPLRPGNELRDDARSLSDLVRRRGAHAPFTLLDRPLYLQRDWTGKLRAFPNVCTHAWHTLVAGPGRDRTITCPQHGRQFDAAGRCLSQPGFSGTEGFPCAADHLTPFPVEEWQGLPFVSLGKPAAPFARAMRAVEDVAGKAGLRRMERRAMPGEVRELEGNWKLHAWNYMDSLHVPFIHRKPGGLADAVDLASYRTELHGDVAVQWVHAKDPAHGLDPRKVPARMRAPGKRVFALWLFVFPNLTINVYPWGASINVYAPVPGKPRRTLFHWYHLVADEELYERRDEVWMMREVDDEDVDALSQVSRGAASGFARRGRFAGEAEAGPHWLHRKVYERAFPAR